MVKSEPQRYLNASIFLPIYLAVIDHKRFLLKGLVLDDAVAELDLDHSVAEASKTHDSACVTVCGIALGHESADDFYEISVLISLIDLNVRPSTGTCTENGVG